jgi:hypothetical protein
MGVVAVKSGLHHSSTVWAGTQKENETYDCIFIASSTRTALRMFPAASLIIRAAASSGKSNFSFFATALNAASIYAIIVRGYSQISSDTTHLLVVGCRNSNKQTSTLDRRNKFACSVCAHDDTEVAHVTLHCTTQCGLRVAREGVGFVYYYH